MVQRYSRTNERLRESAFASRRYQQPTLTEVSFSSSSSRVSSFLQKPHTFRERERERDANTRG